MWHVSINLPYKIEGRTFALMESLATVVAVSADESGKGQRDELGRLLPGAQISKGRVKTLALMRESCREMTPAILKNMAHIATDPRHKNNVAAAKLLLAYGWGAPESHVNLSVDTQRIADIQALPASDIRAILRDNLRRVTRDVIASLPDDTDK